jgi:hypothetical protein
LAPRMALERRANTSVYRASPERGDRRIGGRRPQVSAAPNLTTFKRKPRTSKFAIGFAGFGLLSILPLALLINPLPQDDVSSQAMAPVVTNVFAARWPSEESLRSATTKAGNSLFVSSPASSSMEKADDTKPQETAQPEIGRASCRERVLAMV